MKRMSYQSSGKALLFFVIGLLCSCRDSAEKSPDTSSLYAFSHYGKTFSDLNDTHLSAAQSIGIEPVSSREEAEEMKGKLEEVESNDNYQIDELTHSIPFLVPQAKELLEDIAENMLDSLENKRIPAYTINVTSITRTKDDIKSLQRKNGNSSSNSAHLYGTTFDVSYVRFNQKPSSSWFGSKKTEGASTALLKSVLAQVLYDLRKEDRCYVRYEVKQGCFHITAR